MGQRKPHANLRIESQDKECDSELIWLKRMAGMGRWEDFWNQKMSLDILGHHIITNGIDRIFWDSKIFYNHGCGDFFKFSLKALLNSQMTLYTRNEIEKSSVPSSLR